MLTFFAVFSAVYFRNITVNVRLILCNSLELHDMTLANLNDVLVFMQENEM